MKEELRIEDVSVAGVCGRHEGRKEVGGDAEGERTWWAKERCRNDLAYLVFSNVHSHSR